MVQVSELAKAALNNPASRRRIRILVEADRTLTFEDEDVIGFQFTEQCCGDYDFVLGGVFSEGCAATLSNSTGKLAGTQFQGARISAEEGVEISSDTYEWIPLGVYEVYEVKYQNDTVELSARNFLQRLDRPLSDVNMVYPISLKNAMTLICQRCGVVFSTSEFLNQNYTIEKEPEGNISCRDAVSYIAEIAGCFVRCDRYGRLEFMGFDDTSPAFGEAVLDGNVDTADGGDFTTRYTPVYDGGKFKENEAVITISSDMMYSQSYDGTPIVITGVSFDAGDDTYLFGSSSYCIALSENPFLTHDIEMVLASIGRKLIGCSYVLTSISWPGNPCLQVGDVVEIANRDGGSFRTLVTKNVYRYLKQSTLTSGGTAPSETQYQSESQRIYKRMKSGFAEKQKAIDALDRAIANGTKMLVSAMGGHIFNGADIGYPGEMFIADNADIALAKHVWRYNVNGWGHSSNGINGPYDMGATADNSLWAIMITAAMIRTGLLKSLNGKSWINLDDGSFNLGDGSLVYNGNTFEAISARK